MADELLRDAEYSFAMRDARLTKDAERRGVSRRALLAAAAGGASTPPAPGKGIRSSPPDRPRQATRRHGSAPARLDTVTQATSPTRGLFFDEASLAQPDDVLDPWLELAAPILAAVLSMQAREHSLCAPDGPSAASRPASPCPPPTTAECLCPPPRPCRVRRDRGRCAALVPLDVRGREPCPLRRRGQATTIISTGTVDI
jgi:hypothetical protein